MQSKKEYRRSQSLRWMLAFFFSIKNLTKSNWLFYIWNIEINTYIISSLFEKKRKKLNTCAAILNKGISSSSSARAFTETPLSRTLFTFSISPSSVASNNSSSTINDNSSFVCGLDLDLENSSDFCLLFWTRFVLSFVFGIP